LSITHTTVKVDNDGKESTGDNVIHQYVVPKKPQREQQLENFDKRRRRRTKKSVRVRRRKRRQTTSGSIQETLSLAEMAFASIRTNLRIVHSGTRTTGSYVSERGSTVRSPVRETHV
jgi:hypothetical protein